MTELLTQSGVDSFNAAAADPLFVIIGLVADSFNTDCNECTKAATQILQKASGIPFDTDEVTGLCGANFTGASLSC
jgi:hypothetical protein